MHLNAGKYQDNMKILSPIYFVTMVRGKIVYLHIILDKSILKRTYFLFLIYGNIFRLLPPRGASKALGSKKYLVFFEVYNRRRFDTLESISSYTS